MAAAVEQFRTWVLSLPPGEVPEPFRQMAENRHPAWLAVVREAEGDWAAAQEYARDAREQLQHFKPSYDKALLRKGWLGMSTTVDGAGPGVPGAQITIAPIDPENHRSPMGMVRIVLDEGRDTYRVHRRLFAGGDEPVEDEQIDDVYVDAVADGPMMLRKIPDAPTPSPKPSGLGQITDALDAMAPDGAWQSMLPLTILNEPYERMEIRWGDLNGTPGILAIQFFDDGAMDLALFWPWQRSSSRYGNAIIPVAGGKWLMAVRDRELEQVWFANWTAQGYPSAGAKMLGGSGGDDNDPAKDPKFRALYEEIGAFLYPRGVGAVRGDIAGEELQLSEFYQGRLPRGDWTAIPAILARARARLQPGMTDLMVSPESIDDVDVDEDGLFELDLQDYLAVRVGDLIKLFHKHKGIASTSAFEYDADTIRDSPHGLNLGDGYPSITRANEVDALRKLAGWGAPEDSDRGARIEAIVAASTTKDVESRYRIVEAFELLGTDGKWHGALGFPQGVDSTGQRRSVGFVFETPEGTRVGTRYPSVEVAEEARRRRLTEKADAFRAELRKMSESKLADQEAYWLPKAVTPTTEAENYVRGLRNEAKRRYAQKYLRWIQDGRPPGGEPNRGTLSVMAAQAVRMELIKLFPERVDEPAEVEEEEPEPAEPRFTDRAAGEARGRAAFAEGLKAVPYHDPHLRAAYTTGPAPSNEYAEGWSVGWHEENLRAARPIIRRGADDAKPPLPLAQAQQATYGDGNPNPEPADAASAYYVTTIRPKDNAWVALLGPFETHQEALDKVDAARRRVQDQNLDPFVEYRYGTARAPRTTTVFFADPAGLVASTDAPDPTGPVQGADLMPGDLIVDMKSNGQVQIAAVDIIDGRRKTRRIAYSSTTMGKRFVLSFRKDTTAGGPAPKLTPKAIDKDAPTVIADALDLVNEPSPRGTRIFRSSGSAYRFLGRIGGVAPTKPGAADPWAAPLDDAERAVAEVELVKLGELTDWNWLARLAKSATEHADSGGISKAVGDLLRAEGLDVQTRMAHGTAHGSIDLHFKPVERERLLAILAPDRTYSDSASFKASADHGDRSESQTDYYDPGGAKLNPRYAVRFVELYVTATHAFEGRSNFRYSHPTPLGRMLFQRRRAEPSASASVPSPGRAERTTTSSGASEASWTSPMYGEIKVTAGAEGKRDTWNNLSAVVDGKRMRYGYSLGQSRWARKEIPPEALLVEVARHGHGELFELPESFAGGPTGPAAAEPA